MAEEDVPMWRGSGECREWGSDEQEDGDDGHFFTIVGS